MFYDLYCKLCQEKEEKPSRVADNVGINRSTVSQWKSKYEQGIDITPNSEVLKKISEYFGVSIDYLMGMPATAHLDKIEEVHGKEAAEWLAAGKSWYEWLESHPKLDSHEQKEKPAPKIESELDPLDVKFMEYVHTLSRDQKEMLLAQLRILTEGRK